MSAEEVGLVVASAAEGEAQIGSEPEGDAVVVGLDVEPLATSGALGSDPVGVQQLDEVIEAEELAGEAIGEAPSEDAGELAAEDDAVTVIESEEDVVAASLDVEPVAGSEALGLDPAGSQQLDEDVAAGESAGEATDEVLLEDAAETAVDADEPVPADGRAWYVIHCYSGYENKVKHNLEQRIETMQMQNQIFQVVIPTEDEVEVRDGKRRTVERRVFPGYILVQMVQTDDSWYVVRNTPGVTGFVGMGNEPTALTPEEVQSIMKRMEAEAPRIKVAFKPGERVRIIEGPFNEFIGQVEELDMNRAKVRVLVSFFGRETPVELDFLQVEKT